MTFEQLWLFFLMVPPALWIMWNSRRGYRAHPFVVNLLGPLMLLACALPGCAFRESSAAAAVLIRALASLSDTDLRHGRTD